MVCPPSNCGCKPLQSMRFDKKLRRGLPFIACMRFNKACRHSTRGRSMYQGIQKAVIAMASDETGAGRAVLPGAFIAHLARVPLRPPAPDRDVEPRLVHHKLRVTLGRGGDLDKELFALQEHGIPPCRMSGTGLPVDACNITAGIGRMLQHCAFVSNAFDRVMLRRACDVRHPSSAICQA